MPKLPVITLQRGTVREGPKLDVIGTIMDAWYTDDWTLNTVSYEPKSPTNQNGHLIVTQWYTMVIMVSIDKVSDYRFQ